MAGCDGSSVDKAGGSGSVVVKTPDGRLVADGNDEKTYSLIVSSGYNYETPDKSGEHAK